MSNDAANLTGASRAWTSDDTTPWRAAVIAGAFAEAERSIANLHTPAAIEARDLLGRLRHEWSLTPDALLETLRREIGDVTQADVDAWTASGALESLRIDGGLRYFRREPRNLLLFDADARARAARSKGAAVPADRHDSTAPIIPHLVEVVRASEAAPGRRELLPVRTRVAYAITVKPDRPGARPGSTLRAWLPFPQEYAQQRDVRLIGSEPADALVSPAGSPHRTVYLEQTIINPAPPVRFATTFEYTTYATRWHGLPAHDSRAGSPCHEHLEQRPPHVVFTPAIREIVAELAADSPDKSTLAKRLWNWVDDHIPWRAEHEYCLIPSIVEQALRVRHGDCGVAAITFITLCRCAGIPARWQSGWTTDDRRGAAPNLHDWSEVWLDDVGWIPVDPSYGKKAHADPKVRDFYFGNLDRYRLIVNADFGRPLSPPKASLRSEPLDFQRGEVELDGRNLYFDEWDYTFTVGHEALV